MEGNSWLTCWQLLIKGKNSPPGCIKSAWFFPITMYIFCHKWNNEGVKQVARREACISYRWKSVFMFFIFSEQKFLLSFETLIEVSTETFWQPYSFETSAHSWSSIDKLLTWYEIKTCIENNFLMDEVCRWQVCQVFWSVNYTFPFFQFLLPNFKFIASVEVDI